MGIVGANQTLILRAVDQPATEATLAISAATFVGILDTVRTAVLDWTLNLEKAGILGEGMSFTLDERRRVAESGTANTVNIFGSVQGSQIQVARDHAMQEQNAGIDLQALQEFITALKVRADDLPLTGDARAELDAEIATMEAQLQSPKPKAAVFREALRTLRSLLEGLASSVAATELLRLLTHAQTGPR